MVDDEKRDEAVDAAQERAKAARSDKPLPRQTDDRGYVERSAD